MGAGGAFSSGSYLVVLRSDFTANVGALGFGGLATNSDVVRVADSVFALNESGFNGGGLAISSDARLVNCVFSRNSAAADLGGAIITGWTLDLADCTFGRNLGDGIQTDSYPTSLSNCILWDNAPLQIDGGAAVSFSDVEGGWPGPGNIDGDPLFVQPGTDDLRLSFGSPCIDAGDTSLLPADELDLDGDGDTAEPLPLDGRDSPRVAGESVDMGAYEGAFEIADPADSALDLDRGESVVLVPRGTDFGPLASAAALVVNVSGPDDATYTLTEMDWSLRPEAGGYTELGAILSAQTSLRDGESYTAVFVPFDAASLGRADPLTLDLTSPHPLSGNWDLAVSRNAGNSPGHDGPVGDRNAVEGTGDDFGLTSSWATTACSGTPSSAPASCGPTWITRVTSQSGRPCARVIATRPAEAARSASST